MYAQVAIDCPLYQLFDYRIPPNTDTSTLVGSRIVVPFGRRTVLGVVFQLSVESQLKQNQLKTFSEVLDPAPILDTEILALLQWAAQYYLHPIGKVAISALPPELRKTKPIPARQQNRYWQPSPTYDESVLKRAPKQKAIMDWLQRQSGASNETAIYEQFGHCRTLIRALIERNCLIDAAASPAKEQLNQPQPTSSQNLQLNLQQQTAAQAITNRLGQYQCFLLDGITGSGKTEVYIAAIKEILTRKQQVLLLVPEIGLTPQLQQRLQQALGVTVGMLHSGRSAGDRVQTWLSAARGITPVLIGTRLSVFTPLPKLGLIVVDEEHDSSFKQQEGFLYHGRDIAIYRAHNQSIPIILGSATPSFESLHNVQSGRYRALYLTQRAGDAQLPKSSLIDLRAIQVTDGLSRPVVRALREHLDQHRQVMIFLNRRGYAPTLLCTQCGWLAECTRCDARMTVHKSRSQLICHHCDRTIPLPHYCPECGHSELLQLGEGTQKIEQVLSEQFPDIPVTRLDRDAMRRKNAFQEAFQSIANGDRQIIIGTQMISKGHDFPNLSLVVVIDLDYGFFSTDYRAMERTAQLLVQVAGRAGRREQPGEVLIQTHFPEHPYMQTLLHEGYHAFATLALQDRKAAGLPPYRFHIALRARAQNTDQVYAFLKSVRKLARQMNSEINSFGPIPSSMERKAGYVRAYLLFSAQQRTEFKPHIHQLSKQIASLPLAKKVQWSLDVDPLDSE